uniref:Uncharacterized protein n=1 Tax=Marmota marmota marmota TaxID=9994 RepID=A0A8C6EYF4_MARMA
MWVKPDCGDAGPRGGGPALLTSIPCASLLMKSHPVLGRRVGRHWEACLHFGIKRVRNRSGPCMQSKFQILSF